MIPSSAEVASDYIRTLVFTGVLRTGDKVPIDDIANVLNISRQPVREAIIELAHDGLVNTDGRRGTFVADFGPSIVRDHYELYGLLHSFAMRRVATERDPQVIEALRAFDIIYVLNTPRKTEVLSILTTNNLLGEGGGNVGRGSAYATILFVLCFGFVIWYVTNHYRNTQEGADA